MSTSDHDVIADHLTRERLRSYLAATGGSLADAIALYDWNVSAAGALYEDIGRLEVVFRNALDSSLMSYGAIRGWAEPWYRQAHLFPGALGARSRDDIATAVERAERNGAKATHGKVVAELTFGFWRYLCTKHYFTSLWVPALNGAFPNHPQAGTVGAVRRDVYDRIQRVHFLRNRIAHHEPIHRRELGRDHTAMLEIAGWIDATTSRWIEATSRTPSILADRPAQRSSSSG